MLKYSLATFFVFTACIFAHAKVVEENGVPKEDNNETTTEYQPLKCTPGRQCSKINVNSDTVLDIEIGKSGRVIDKDPVYDCPPVWPLLKCKHLSKSVTPTFCSKNDDCKNMRHKEICCPDSCSGKKRCIAPLIKVDLLEG